MNNFALLVGLGIFAFLLVYMFFKLGERGDGKHYVLQVLMLGFILLVFVLIAKATMDEKDYCSWNVVNSTTVGTYNVYNYDYLCKTNTHNTTDSFYETVMWVVRVVGFYMFFYFIYEVIKYFYERGKSA